MNLLTTPSSRDLYAILGLPETATPDEIRQRFKNISKAHHPDITGGVESEFYKQCRHAHDILMDPVARSIYDSTGEDPDSKDKNQYSMALKTIHRHTVTILENGWTEANFLKQLTKSLQEEIKSVDAGITEGIGLVDGAKKLKANMLKRWSGAAKVSNVIITSCDQTIEKHEEGLRRIKMHRECLDLCMRMLQQARYDWQEYSNRDDELARAMILMDKFQKMYPPQNTGRW